MKKKLVAGIIALMVILINVFGCLTVNAEEIKPELPDTEETPAVLTKADGDLSLQLRIDFDSNRFFSRYDVNVFLDGQRIGAMNHGQSFTATLGVSKGVHTLTFENTRNSAVRGESQFRVFADSEYTCIIHAYKGCVGVRDERLGGSRIDHEPLRRELYIAACEPLNYESILRYPEKYDGYMVRISGQIKQVREIPFLGKYMLYVSDGGNIWYAFYERKANEERIIPGDFVTVYGECEIIPSYILGILVDDDWSTLYPTVKTEYIVRRPLF